MPVATLRQPIRLISLSDIDSNSKLYPNELIADISTGDLYINKDTGARIFIKNVSPKTTTLKDSGGSTIGTILPESQKNITIPDATSAVRGFMTPTHVNKIASIDSSLTGHMSEYATDEASGHIKLSNLAAVAPASTASVGTSDLAARADHVHPVQTSVSGNAGTATKLATARTIGLTGVTATATSFDGSANINIPITAIPASLITGLEIPQAGTASPKVAGTASAGTATTFSRSDHVHPVQTAVSGNAGTATKLATARKIGLTGVTATATSFDGSGDINIPITAIPVDLITGLTIPAASSVAPKAAGTATIGTSTDYARADHVHPVQTTVSGNAGTATKLATARTIGLTGITATATNFDGSTNINIPVTAIPASIITGIISLDNLPAGALERMVVVADATARFALTSNEVQTGDTVKEEDTGLMYYVKDHTKLDTEAGYEIYTAGSASTVPWSGVTGKPTFATVATSGSYNDLINLPSIPVAGTASPKVAGTASAGTATTFSRSDHVHPVQTSVSGNAGTATKLAVKRKIGLTGVTATAIDFDGSGDINIPVTAVPASIITGLDIPVAATVKPAAPGTATIGTSTDYARADHVHQIQTTVSGNAGTATKLATARTIGLTGVTATATSFDGSANINIPITAIPASLITGLTLPSASDDDPLIAGTASAGTATTFSRSDHVHPVQTSVSGNAGTATTLAVARTIGLSGVTATAQSFNGSANITIPITAVPASLITGLSIPTAGTVTPVDGGHGTAVVGTSTAYAREDHVHGTLYGVCATTGSTSTKVVSCGLKALTTGTTVLVKFSYTNTYTSSYVYLNVDNTGAYQIRWENDYYGLYNALKANQIYEFCWDGTYWRIVGGALENTYTTSIPATSWSANSTGYYTKTVTVYGLNSNDNPIIDLVPSATFDTAKQQMEAYSLIYRITTSNNSITIYATGIPAVAIPIQVKVIR